MLIEQLNESLNERLHQVQDRILKACSAANRNPEEVSLLAVSKFHPSSSIEQLACAGQLHFGENYVQEMLTKARDLQHLALHWHFIGPLQSNKCKEVAQTADSLHSVDRVKLLAPLAKYRQPEQAPLNIYLQVNIDDEQSKSGVKGWDELIQLAETCLQYPQLELIGLMTIPAPCKDQDAQRKPFAQLRELRDKLEQHLQKPLPKLSMGMSADLEAAIYEGATIVRVGTDIFGSRSLLNKK